MLEHILNMLFGRGALQQAAAPTNPNQPSPNQQTSNPGVSIQDIMAMAQQQAAAEEERKRKLKAIQDSMVKSKIGNVPAMLQGPTQ